MDQTKLVCASCHSLYKTGADNELIASQGNTPEEWDVTLNKLSELDKTSPMGYIPWVQEFECYVCEAQSTGKAYGYSEGLRK